MKSTVRTLLVLPSVLFLIWYSPLPLPLKAVGFIGATLWICGLRQGGKTLLISLPIFASWLSVAYFPVSQRAVGVFVIAYMMILLVIGIVGLVRLNRPVRQFVAETRKQLDDLRSRAV